MTRSFFYPPGREKIDAIGALDLALWDIRGKALNLPVHAVLGGMVRNYCECYNTAGIIPGVQRGMGLKERAQLTIAAGYRAFRMGAADAPANTTFNTHERLNQLYDGLRGGARRRGQERRLVRRLPPALRPLRSHSRLRADPRSRAVLRRGPGPHRGLQAGSAHSAAAR